MTGSLAIFEGEFEWNKPGSRETPDYRNMQEFKNATQRSHYYRQSNLGNADTQLK